MVSDDPDPDLGDGTPAPPTPGHTRLAVAILLAAFGDLHHRDAYRRSTAEYFLLDARSRADRQFWVAAAGLPEAAVQRAAREHLAGVRAMHHDRRTHHDD